MNILFLRGQVPKDRPSSQIAFNSLNECDDMWTHLAYKISSGHGEVCYTGASRHVKYTKHFSDKWVPDIKNYKAPFEPEVIFARGGFPYYDNILNKYKGAFKIYYGAGKRFYPKTFSKYNLILVDTPQQQAIAKKKFPNIRVELFIKPAAENIFKPLNNEKKYDVIFIANEHKFKGHKFILPQIPPDIKLIQVGLNNKKIRNLNKNVEFIGWVPRNKLPELYSQSKIAIVCCDNIDSCPRVIPEALACNCPILLRESVNLWIDKYINQQTGMVSTDAQFIDNMRNMIQNYHLYSPGSYYQSNLSLDIAAERIKRLILEIKG